MENDDFANVSWQNDPAGQGRTSTVTSPGGEGEDDGSGNTNGKRRGSAGPLGRHADAMDLAGVGEGVLECTVTQPIKENDGTKDAYVSYLVTTNVSIDGIALLRLLLKLTMPDYFPLLPEADDHGPQTLHGFRLPVQDVK